MLVAFIAFVQRCLLATCCLIGVTAPALAQSISISPASLDEGTRSQLLSTHSFYLNGPISEGLGTEIKGHMYAAGPMGRTLLALTALRMEAAGMLSLDDPVSATLSDTLDANPFRVAVTARHLLTETAGFAVPPVITGSVPLARYVTHVRTAGQMAHADTVGWALLVAFLEARGEANIASLIETNVLNALGLTGSSLEADTSSGELIFLQSLKISGQLVAEVARLMVRNRDASGGRFLPPALYEQLGARHNWRMHPLDPRRTLGGVMHTAAGRTWIGPPELQPGPDHLDRDKPTFMAFPSAGIVFVNLRGLSADYRSSVLALANDRFLPAPPDLRLREASGLYDEEVRFSGNYVLSSAPSAWLAARLRATEFGTIHLSDPGDRTLKLVGLKGSNNVKTYHKKAPFYFEAPSGSQMILSPYRQGGYLVLDGTLYRYSGVLGNRTFVIKAFPYVVIFLLTCGIYLRSKVSNRWRKMAQFGLVGTLLVGGGAACEFFLWPKAVFVWDMPLLANLWRLAINAGLALLLSLPMFALSFTRKEEMPKDSTILYAPLHLALLSVAAVALFLITIAWGIAGEFSAY